MGFIRGFIFLALALMIFSACQKDESTTPAAEPQMNPAAENNITDFTVPADGSPFSRGPTAGPFISEPPSAPPNF